MSSVHAVYKAFCGSGRVLVGLCGLFALTTALSAQEPFDIPLRINMGGEETVDSQGNLWLGDRPCGLGENADPLGIRPNLGSGFHAICDWCVADPLAFEELDLDPFDPGDSHIFSTIRWDEGGDAEDFYVELPVENGVYDINLYFNECCCTGRHFKIEVEGNIEYQDVSYLVYNTVPGLTKVGRLDVRSVEVTDESLTIGFLPCPECPGVSDTNAIINAIEVLPGGGDPCDEPSLPHLCASGLECTVDANGAVTGTWTAPVCGEADGFQILKNGDVLEEFPGDATEFTDTLGEDPGAEYQLVTMLDGGNEFCPSPTCAVKREDFVFEIPLRINMGGEETVDSQGNLWLGDRPCGLGENADPLGIRPNLGSGFHAICDWCVADPLAFEELDLDPFDPGDSHIFSTIRWDEGGDAEHFYVELPVENGVYDINLYFNECCCTGRHFKVEVEGKIEYEDVSYLVYNPDPALTKVGKLDVRGAEVTDGSLTIGFLPCPECPGVSDTNAIINAIEVLPASGDPCDEASLPRLCSSEFQCTIGENGAVSGSWTAPQCGEPTGYQILKNGDVLLELPADATEFTDTLEDRAAEYQLVTMLPGGEGPCPTPICAVSRNDILFDIPLRINMGGEETEDSQGNIWLGDRPCGLGENADPLGIRPNLNSGFHAICDWCVPDALAFEELDLDPFHPGDAHIFSTIRWDEGGDGVNDFYVELPVPNGEYDINLYFNECCCTGRHFKIEVQGEIEYEDVSYLEYSDEPALTKVGMLDVTNVIVDNQILKIGFLPCPECPGATDNNAIINAIEVLGEPAPPKTVFNRGDPNDDGTANITDSVFILSNLFSGGDDPTCRESADVNDDGTVNITDPIALLTFLFGGDGEPTPPAAPGTPDTPCGPDPDGSQDLGCNSYTSCQ